MKKIQLLIVVGMSISLTAHTNNEIQAFIDSADYDSAMNCISTLPAARVVDRQKLLLSMLDAWTTDEAVGNYASRIKKAADALVGGNRNVIYKRISTCLSAAPISAQVSVTTPVDIPATTIITVIPPAEPIAPVVYLPQTETVTNVEATANSIIEHDAAKAQPQATDLTLPLIDILPIIEDQIHIPQPMVIDFDTIHANSSAHTFGFWRSAAMVAAGVGLGIAGLWQLIAEKKENKKTTPTSTDDTAPATVHKCTEPKIPLRQQQEAQPFSAILAPSNVHAASGANNRAPSSDVEDSEEEIDDDNQASSDDESVHDNEKKTSASQFSTRNTKSSILKLNMLPTDSAEEAKAALVNFSGQLHQEQEHFEARIQAYNQKGHLKSTEHRMLVQRNQHIVQAIRDLTTALASDSMSKLSLSDHNDLDGYAGSLLHKIMANENKLAELRKKILDPRTQKFEAAVVQEMQQPRDAKQSKQSSTAIPPLKLPTQFHIEDTNRTEETETPDGATPRHSPQSSRLKEPQIFTFVPTPLQAASSNPLSLCAESPIKGDAAADDGMYDDDDGSFMNSRELNKSTEVR